MVLVISILVFIVVALVSFLTISSFEVKNAQAQLLRERLEVLDHAVDRNPTEELAVLRQELLSEIPALNAYLSRSRHATLLQKFLSQAGVEIRAGKFILLTLCGAAVAAFAANMFLHWWVWTLMAGLAVGSIPFAYVSFRRSQRFHKFESMFPEAIDLLARAVRAGHAFSTGIELIANELADPIAEEFRMVFEQQKFGLPLRDSLLNFTERMPLLDVKFFVTAVLLQRETGGNLAEILDNLSHVIRERFKILRQVRVHTAHGRITMAILMVLPPALLVIMSVMNPDFIKPLFKDPIGHMLIAASIVMQTIGFFLLRRIVRIKV